MNLLDNRQHGFLNDRSCTTQMIPFTNDLALVLNNRSRADVIYFDFAKAFDSVSHDLILQKLKYKVQYIYTENNNHHLVQETYTSSEMQVIIPGTENKIK